MSENIDQITGEDKQQLTKGERKRLKREDKRRQKERAVEVQARRKLAKRALLWGLPVLIIAGAVWAVTASPKSSNDDIVSRRGIHWHTSLSITINGEQQEIPGNIGIGGVHKDIHTHQINDTLHVEINRPVREDDIRIKNFFDIWGERFTSECILDVCNSEDGMVKMLVNGEENFEFENYLMQDGDLIEIVYEKELNSFSTIEETQAAANGTNQIIITSGNLFYRPDRLTLKQGEPVTLTFANTGFHTFTVDELGVDELIEGSSSTIKFTPTQSGTFEFYCAVPGHREGGMVGTLTVQ